MLESFVFSLSGYELIKRTMDRHSTLLHRVLSVDRELVLVKEYYLRKIDATRDRPARIAEKEPLLVGIRFSIQDVPHPTKSC